MLFGISVLVECRRGCRITYRTLERLRRLEILILITPHQLLQGVKGTCARWRGRLSQSTGVPALNIDVAPARDTGSPRLVFFAFVCCSCCGPALVHVSGTVFSSPRRHSHSRSPQDTHFSVPSVLIDCGCFVCSGKWRLQQPGTLGHTHTMAMPQRHIFTHTQPTRPPVPAPMPRLPHQESPHPNPRCMHTRMMRLDLQPAHHPLALDSRTPTQHHRTPATRAGLGSAKEERGRVPNRIFIV